EDGSHVVMVWCGGDDGGWVYVWNGRTGESLFEAHEQLPFTQRASATPCGDYVVIASGNDKLALWALTGKAALYKHGLELRDSTARTATLSPDGKTLASTVQYEDRRQAYNFTLWETYSGLPRRKLFSIPQGEYAYHYSFSPDGRYLVIAHVKHRL